MENLSNRNYFVDSIRIPQKAALLYVGYAKDELDTPNAFLLLSTPDTCIMMAGVITCDACIGRTTIGSTYRGAVVKNKVVMIKQHTFNYGVEIYISMRQQVPMYQQIIVKSLIGKSGKRCIKTFLPRKATYLTDLGFMTLWTNDKNLAKYFSVKKTRY
ncbi:MAG: hypothetical protein ABI378_10930 [Chitinophagaceae bacterium]